MVPLWLPFLEISLLLVLIPSPAVAINVAVAFSKDGNTASKIIYNFAKKNPGLKLKAGVAEGKVLTVDQLKVVANLPDKNGMLSMLLSVLQAPIRNLACAVKAVGEKEN